MKKVFVIAAAAMMLAACQKEEVSTTKTISLNASMEQMSGDSKTTFGTDGLSIVWEANDAILVIDQNGKSATLKATKGGSETTFTGEVGDDFGTIKYAFYPASIFSNYKGNTIDFTLNPNRPCSVDALASGANPSWATVEEGATSANFKNLCGILKITVDVQKAGLTSLILEDLQNVISGTMTLTLSGKDAGNVKGGKVQPGVNNIANIRNSGELTQEKHVFYFVAPAGALYGGAIVYGNSRTGSSTTYVMTDKNNSLSKSKIRVMPELYWDAMGLHK